MIRTRWQEVLGEAFPKIGPLLRDEPGLCRALLRELNGVDDPAEVVIRLYRVIGKIDQLADVIDEIAARETRIQLAQAGGLRAVTGEL